MPPIDHWSIGRPHAAPLGLQAMVSLVVIAVGTAPVSVPPTPLTGGTGPSGVPPRPLDEGAVPVSFLPAPKYRRVGLAPVNGYLDVSSNWPLPRS